MNETALPESLRPFFQEYDFGALDPEQHAELIIERTLRYGNRAELRWLFRRYGQARIAVWFAAMGAQRLPRRHVPFWSLVLDVEPQPRHTGGVWPY